MARRDIGASVLIDDNPLYAVECAEAGMEVLLYDWQLCYPWSKTLDGCACASAARGGLDWRACSSLHSVWASLSALAGCCRPAHPRIRRVQDWTEVEEALAELALLPPHR